MKSPYHPIQVLVKQLYGDQQVTNKYQIGMATIMIITSAEQKEPSSVAEAKFTPDNLKWEKAMKTNRVTLVK